MEIHGTVYLIVGASVIAFTHFVVSVNPESKITLFFWAGVLFIAVGAFKIIKNLILRGADKDIGKKNTKEKTDFSKFGFNKDLGNVKLNENLLRQRREYESSNQMISCPNCSKNIKSTSIFCTYCGTRIR